MLLRRVTEHVKAQNWTAVALDFVIVVTGVFMGIQVSNWNDARRIDAQEDGYLADLRQEIATNIVMTEGRLKLMNVVMNSGERAIAFLDGGTRCETNCWSLLVDFFNASQVMYMPPSKTVYEEMQRLGLPRSDAVKPAIAAYYQFDAATTFAIDTQPEYRKHVREHISVPAQRALWKGCYAFDGVTESLIPDCAPGVAEQESRVILEAFRADPALRGQLTYWVGMHTMWTPILAVGMTVGEAAIEAIDLELGVTK